MLGDVQVAYPSCDLHTVNVNLEPNLVIILERTECNTASEIRVCRIYRNE